jgi:hypothetical protein
LEGKASRIIHASWRWSYLVSATPSGSYRPETRNPKAEGRKKAEIRNPKGEPAPSRRPGLQPSRQRLNQRQQKGKSKRVSLRVSDFGLLSAFGFRVSGFRPVAARGAGTNKTCPVKTPAKKPC